MVKTLRDYLENEVDYGSLTPKFVEDWPDDPSRMVFPTICVMVARTRQVNKHLNRYSVTLTRSVVPEDEGDPEEEYVNIKNVAGFEAIVTIDVWTKDAHQQDTMIDIMETVFDFDDNSSNVLKLVADEGDNLGRDIDYVWDGFTYTEEDEDSPIRFARGAVSCYSTVIKRKTITPASISFGINVDLRDDVTIPVETEEEPS